jgi:outer membrane protein OmpA-like peptidoglycan-associated protein
MRITTFAGVFLLLLPGVACRDAAPPPSADAAKTAASADAAKAAASADPSQSKPSAEALADAKYLFPLLEGRGQSVPDGLVAGGDCPSAGPTATEEMAAQAAATVPLTEGLTLAYNWQRTREEPEYECLIQVKKIDADGILTTASCDVAGDVPSPRRVCRADLRSAHMLHTLYGVVKVIGASGAEEPETITGATAFSLSRDDFAQLKRTGRLTHHYVELAGADRLAKDGVGELQLEGRQTMSVIVNDRPLELPVITVRGTMKWWIRGNRLETQDTLVILDDERFPLLIDNGSTNDTASSRIYFSKVTYPSGGRGRGASGGGSLRMKGGSLEEGLIEDKRVDVYGIYFDFNSDRIRPESQPVLEEIGSIMKAHPDWRLSIQGHTDNVGGNGQYNLDLSRRRSAAVRLALVKQFGIADDRLSSGGSGAASPKDTNDTPEGRARNRRVELVRQ